MLIELFSSLLPCRFVANMILLPSGDQLGSVCWPLSSGRSRRGLPPLEETIQASDLPCGDAAMKTISEPSGDQLSHVGRKGGSLSCTRSLPSLFAFHRMCSGYETYATDCPSL